MIVISLILEGRHIT